MYLVDMVKSTWVNLIKTFTNELFYLGGIFGGFLFYLTGLSIGELQSILIVIFLDVGTRVWAERVNNRPILSRRMFFGFSGKLASYMILFILAQHSFIFKDALQYIILGGFSIVEFRSVYENLIDAKQKHIVIIGDKVSHLFDKFAIEKVETPKIVQPQTIDKNNFPKV